MLDTPQKVEITFNGFQYYFYAYRFTTDKELVEALHRDTVTDPAAYEKNVLAWTESYPEADECGRMYLLDKSVETLANQAVQMAFNIYYRYDFSGGMDDMEGAISVLAGKITSELYSQSKHF